MVLRILPGFRMGRSLILLVHDVGWLVSLALVWLLVSGFGLLLLGNTQQGFAHYIFHPFVANTEQMRESLLFLPKRSNQEKGSPIVWPSATWK